VASGTVKPGDTLLALPSGRKTRLQSVVTFDGNLPEASPGMSVTLKLEDEIDLSRGGMLVTPEAVPQKSRHFEAMTVWMHSKPLELNRTYLIKHTSRQIKAKATRIRYRVDVNTFAHSQASQLEMNGIASVEFETTEPLFFDSYRDNRTTGSFILIEPLTNSTVGAGMISAGLDGVAAKLPTESSLGVHKEEREQRHGHRAGLIVVNEFAQASHLERVLFENHFEVAAIRNGGFSADSYMVAVNSLLQGGFVELGNTSAGTEESVSLVLQFAQKLRTKTEPRDSGGVH